MKSITGTLILVVILHYTNLVRAQELQIHYDFRHSIDPGLYPKNLPILDFKYFTQIDTNKTGTFLIEAKSILDGEKGNVGQSFFQISQSLKFWNPPVYANIYFSGGLGVTPGSFGYYISNAYSAGISYTLAFTRTWFNFSLLYRYSAFKKPSYDPQFNFWVGGALFNYKLRYSSTLVLWSNNKNDGSGVNESESGKKVLFFADPQLWYNLGKGFSIGSMGNVSYNLVEGKKTPVYYPTIGIKKEF
jgi:hypothetical protein